MYSNEFDTEPETIPSQTYTFTLSPPNTNLEEEFEEVTVDESSEIIPYLNKQARFKIARAFPDYAGEEVFGFQHIEGGYKVYADPEARRRWYFKTVLELPYSLIVDGNIAF